MAIAGGVVTYFVSDVVTALLVSIALAFATAAGLILGLRVSYWLAI